MTDQTQTTTEPVACPFCGGEAWLNDYEAKHSDLPPQSRAPQCRSCGVSPGYAPTAKKAIAAWNMRTTPQPLAIGLDREADVVAEWLAMVEDCSLVGPTGVLRYPPICTSEIEAIRRLALSAPAEGWQGIETERDNG